jgi:hypothetical protein
LGQGLFFRQQLYDFLVVRGVLFLVFFEREKVFKNFIEGPNPVLKLTLKLFVILNPDAFERLWIVKVLRRVFHHDPVDEISPREAIFYKIEHSIHQ